MRAFRLLLAASAMAALIQSCASHAPSALRWSPGVAMLGGGRDTTRRTAVAAVRLESDALLRHEGRSIRFRLAMVADSTRGRLEALGPMGVSVASVVWNDSAWRMWLPGQNALVVGTGDSITIPSLGLRGLRPAELAWLMLGHPLPRIRPGTRLKVRSAGLHRSVVAPAVASPTWAALMDKETGLPLRVQRLAGSREEASCYLSGWRDRLGAPIPDSLVLGNAHGQSVSLSLRRWTLLPELDTTVLDFGLVDQVDTILVDRTASGPSRYQMRPAGTPTDSSLAEVADTLEVDTAGGELVDPPDDSEEPADDDSTAEDSSAVLVPSVQPDLPVTPRQIHPTGIDTSLVSDRLRRPG